MKQYERKFLAHFIDANFGEETPNYVRLGQDLEEYQEELNPDVEVSKNILGEQRVVHSGYEVQSEADPFYAYDGEPLFEQLFKIANNRSTGDDCKTTRVEVLFPADTDFSQATITATGYVEDCYVVPSSVGGDTSGVQIPFTVYNAGNRKEVSVSYTVATKTLTITEE